MRKKMPLNTATKRYMISMYQQYLDKKLTDHETLQLFQDLLDSGFLYHLNDEKMVFYAKGLIEKGFLEDPNSTGGNLH